ncbi:DnaA ATPase domain-containing protein, partial [Pseudomonas aeruginosa]|uniref:DnaA ATPase domain-containing protein n=1 Tax=Pseudomonas aeruginosa TaxID=287 RepID=UPI0039797F18
HKVELEFVTLKESEVGAPVQLPLPEVTAERDERPHRSEAHASLNPRYTFKTFVRGASNSLASAAAIAVAE